MEQGKRLNELNNQQNQNKANQRPGDQKHKIFDYIGEETSYAVVRLPNEECYYYSLSKKQMPLIEGSELTQGTIVFVCIQGQTHLSGVCKVEKEIDLSDEIRGFWAGSFKQVYQIEWLLPICNLPFLKVFS